MRRALERRLHSKSVFGDGNANAAAGPAGAQKPAAQPGDDAALADVGFSSVWDAARAGNVREVKRLVAEQRLDVRAHDPSDGGQTLLHHACWRGDLGFCWYVVDVLSRTWGASAVRALANAVDSSYSGTTPLMALCRTTQGSVGDRVEILDMLLGKGGADPLRQDCHGDNCLHWAARRRAAPLVRMLLRTEGALFLATAKNHKGLTPVDAAERENDRAWRLTEACRRRARGDAFCATCEAPHTSPSAMADVVEQLQGLVRGGGLRLKLVRNAQLRATAAAAATTERAVEEAGLMRHAAQLVERARGLREAHRAQAERARRKEEKRAEGVAEAAAADAAEEWLETKEGLAWERKAVRRIVREQRLAGKKIGPKARRETAAKARRQYVADQCRQARSRARRAFRAEPGGFPSFECPVLGCEAVFVEEQPFLEHQIACPASAAVDGELDQRVLEQQQRAQEAYERLMETAWTHVKVQMRDRREQLQAIKERAMKKQEELEHR